MFNIQINIDEGSNIELKWHAEFDMFNVHFNMETC
jgi:hypothetical protein